jgi:hypothetical protein
MHELSIRAATVTAVELLVQELKHKQQQRCDGGSGKRNRAEKKPWTADQTYLWQVGEHLQAEGKLQPQHRVRTAH